MKCIDFRSLVLVMIVLALHVPAFAQATPALPSPLSLIDVIRIYTLHHQVRMTRSNAYAHP